MLIELCKGLQTENKDVTEGTVADAKAEYFEKDEQIESEGTEEKE